MIDEPKRRGEENERDKGLGFQQNVRLFRDQTTVEVREETVGINGRSKTMAATDERTRKKGEGNH